MTLNEKKTKKIQFARFSIEQRAIFELVFSFNTYYVRLQLLDNIPDNVLSAEMRLYFKCLTYYYLFFVRT